jgi:type VI protein secretion system component VasK
MLFILAGHAMLHLQIMNLYYPDRLVPGSLVITRIILSILSWAGVVILSIVFIQFLQVYKGWARSDLNARLIYSTLLLLTIVSFLELILQTGLIRHIRKNHNKHLLNSINQIGQPPSAYNTAADGE